MGAQIKVRLRLRHQDSFILFVNILTGSSQKNYEITEFPQFKKQLNTQIRDYKTRINTTQW